MPPDGGEASGPEEAAPAPVAGAIVRTVAVSAMAAPAATTETRVLFMVLIMHRVPTAKPPGSLADQVATWSHDADGPTVAACASASSPG